MAILLVRSIDLPSYHLKARWARLDLLGHSTEEELPSAVDPSGRNNAAIHIFGATFSLVVA
jgi:hypothetical protein